MSKYIRLLQENPEYAKLWFGQVISLAGDWFNTVALLGLVAAYSEGSGIAISIFFVLRTLPPLLAGPFAGVLLDRYNRKHLLVWSNVLRAVVVPFFLLANSPDLLWVIYVITVVQFTLSTIFEPGQAAIIPALVKPEDILEGNTLMSVTWSVMLALGAILGGVFAYIFGVEAALLADAVTFAVAAGLLMWMEYDPEKGRKLRKSLEAESQEVEDTSFREGLRYVRQTPQIAAALLVKFGQSLGNVDTIMTVFATQIFVIGTNGELSLAILWSVFGLGAIAGPLVANRFSDNSVRRLRRLIGVGFGLILLGWPVIAVAPTLLILAVGFFLRATGGSINWTYSNIVIQKTAPDEKLGRMFSIDMAAFYFATVLSTIIHGTLIDVLGKEHISLIVWGTAVVAFVPFALWQWVTPKLEKLDEQAQLATEGSV